MSKKILLVINNQKLRNPFCAFFEEMGYSVKVSADAKSSIEMVGTYQPDLIICESNLPVISGMELAKVLKSHQKSAPIPVIIITEKMPSLEEMERLVSARLTMNFTGDEYYNYLLDDDELYLKLVLPDGKYLKLNKGKFRQVDPVIKPEDMIACRVEFEARWLSHNL